MFRTFQLHCIVTSLECTTTFPLLYLDIEGKLPTLASNNVPPIQMTANIYSHIDREDGKEPTSCRNLHGDKAATWWFLLTFPAIMFLFFRHLLSFVSLYFSTMEITYVCMYEGPYWIICETYFLIFRFPLLGHCRENLSQSARVLCEWWKNTIYMRKALRGW